MIQADTHLENSGTGRELKGWHVLLIMLAFFGVMFSVNGVFLFHAITSFPGEDIKKSYVQGLSFNDTLANRAAQAELGWSAEAGLVDDQLILRLQDAEKAPLSSQLVVAELRRLATNQEDRTISFQPRMSGEYVADTGRLAPGQWLLRINVFDADGETIKFHVEKTLIVS
ncbi:MAG: FixH family protein [Pseudomonadota bacterium]